MNMGAVFRDAVARFPDRTAIVDPDVDRRYTYDEWDSRVRTVGGALQASGIEPGDSVAIAMENREETVTVFWATQLLGAEFVPLNFRSAGGELAYFVNNVAADCLFFSDVSRESVLEGADEFETVDDLIDVDEEDTSEAMSLETFLSRDDGFKPTFVDPDETSLVLHTSGTTGNPKGVPISHQANYSRTVGNPIHLDWRQGETTLGITPNFHEMGRATIASSVMLNGTYVAQREWSAKQGYELIESEDIDILYLVPTLFHDLVDYEGADEYDVSSVRTTGYAGTAMSERVHERVREVFDPESFVNFYGCSEMNAMATCSWLEEKPSCAGRAGIHTRVRVVEPIEGKTVSPDRTVPTGELGEIIIDATSPEAFDGYLNRPEANETSFEDGWYFTGDLGHLDENGDLWVVGRVDDMIISGGENIYPVEVEDLLDSNDLVSDVAIGSIEHDRWGEAVTAYVTPSAEGEYTSMAAELDEFCLDSQQLADFKRPRKYVFIEEIPKSNVGKKLRRKLRADDLDDIDVTILDTIEP